MKIDGHKARKCKRHKLLLDVLPVTARHEDGPTHAVTVHVTVQRDLQHFNGADLVDVWVDLAAWCRISQIPALVPMGQGPAAAAPGRRTRTI